MGLFGTGTSTRGTGYNKSIRGTLYTYHQQKKQTILLQTLLQPLTIVMMVSTVVQVICSFITFPAGVHV